MFHIGGRRSGRLAAGLAAGVAALLAAIALAPGASGASTTTRCPSGGVPAPGSTINGALEIDGDCTVNDVTVNGPVILDSKSGLGLENSTVNGNLTVNHGAELDVNQALHGGPPSGSGTINGTVNLYDPIDFDIFGETITNGFNVHKDNGLKGPGVCASNISGGLLVTDAHAVGAINIGDPEDPPAFYGEPCAPNIINGGLTFNNVDPGVIEGNTINGPVTLTNSTTQFNGNTINGTVTCDNGTVITPGESPDPPSNTCS